MQNQSFNCSTRCTAGKRFHAHNGWVYQEQRSPRGMRRGAWRSKKKGRTTSRQEKIGPPPENFICATYAANAHRCHQGCIPTQRATPEMASHRFGNAYPRYTRSALCDAVGVGAVTAGPITTFFQQLVDNPFSLGLNVDERRLDSLLQLAQL